MLKDGPGAFDWVRERVLAGQGGTFAVAFWGAGAVDKLGLASRPSEKRITIICNLAMGGTNPNEVRRLLKLENVSVRQSDKLHAKSYRFDDAVLIGSSNASANGLSFEGDSSLGWHEASLITSDPKVLANVDAWQKTLGVYEIRNQDLIAAEKTWRIRRQMGARQEHAAQDIIQWLYEGPEAFAGRSIYLTAYTDPDLSSEGEVAAKQAKDRYGAGVDYFEDWPTLPKEGVLVSFNIRDDGTINRADGVFERRPDLVSLPIEEGEKGRKLELCFKLGQGKQLSRQHNVWQQVLFWLKKLKYDPRTHQGWDSRSRAGFIDLGMVAKAIDNAKLKLPPLT